MFNLGVGDTIIFILVLVGVFDVGLILGRTKIDFNKLIK